MTRPSTITIATRPAWLACALLLFGTLGLGCVDLDKPPALAHPNSSAAGARAGNTSAGSSGTGGTGSNSSGTAGASGTGGIDSTGGATGGETGGAGGGTNDDGGMGGNTNPSSSEMDALGTGGNTAIDAPSDRPQSKDAPDAGAGGSGGKTGSAGSSGTRSDAGPDRPDGRAGGTGGTTRADAGGTGGTTPPDAGQDRPDAAADTREAAVPDTNPPDAPCALCAIGASLIHRYRFDGSGTRITDSVGTAHGTAVNTTLPNNGTLVLAGGTSNQHATLPAGIISSLTSATLEIWVTWNGGGDNQRILDFGSSRTVGSNTYAATTVIISPNSIIDSTVRLRASYCSTNCGEETADDRFVDNGTSALTTGSRQQIVVVFDGPGGTMSMYLNGAPVGTPATEVAALSQIDDVNNYLGKSQYSFDPGFGGTYHEFRIYNAPLTAAQVQAVYTAGTDAQFDR